MMQCGWLRSGPQQWLRCVHRQVRVKAGQQQGEELLGWSSTVDPVSYSVVSVNLEEDGGGSVRVVSGHSVEHVEVSQEADPEVERRLRSFFLPQNSPGSDPEESRRKRSGLCRWFQKNSVPVEEDGTESKVAGVSTVRAPYGPDDCCSANQIISDRIQRLIRSQPDPVPETDPVPIQTGSRD